MTQVTPLTLLALAGAISGNFRIHGFSECFRLLFSCTTFRLHLRHPQPQQTKVRMEAGGPGGKCSSRRDQIAAILQSCPPLLQSYPGMETE